MKYPNPPITQIFLFHENFSQNVNPVLTIDDYNVVKNFNSLGFLLKGFCPSTLMI